MFEGLAHAYINQSAFAIKAISFGLIVVGAFIAAATRSAPPRLNRVRFFTGTAVCILAMQVGQGIWLDVFRAMDGEYLISLVVAELSISLVTGILLGQLSIGRSRDAFGTGAWAFLAFIPIAAFWLFFTKSRELDVREGWARVRAGALVVMGFLAFATGTFTNLWLRDQMQILVRDRQTTAALAALKSEV